MQTLPHPPPPAKNNGNRCGHDRRNPRTYDGRAALPTWRTVQVAIPALLFGPGLHRVFTLPRGALRAIPRSERREALGLVVPYCLGLTNWRNKRFTVSRARIAHQTGMTLTRVKRVIETLKRIGWVSGFQERKRKTDGQYAHQVAVRWFTMRFFRLVGAGDDIERMHAKAGLPIPRDPSPVRKFVSQLADAMAVPDRRTC